VAKSVCLIHGTTPVFDKEAEGNHEHPSGWSSFESGKIRLRRKRPRRLIFIILVFPSFKLPSSSSFQFSLNGNSKFLRSNLWASRYVHFFVVCFLICCHSFKTGTTEMCGFTCELPEGDCLQTNHTTGYSENKIAPCISCSCLFTLFFVP
jgi:hypothetical protein